MGDEGKDLEKLFSDWWQSQPPKLMAIAANWIKENPPNEPGSEGEWDDYEYLNETFHTGEYLPAVQGTAKDWFMFAAGAGEEEPFPGVGPKWTPKKSFLTTYPRLDHEDLDNIVAAAEEEGRKHS